MTEREEVAARIAAQREQYPGYAERVRTLSHEMAAETAREQAGISEPVAERATIPRAPRSARTPRSTMSRTPSSQRGSQSRTARSEELPARRRYEVPASGPRLSISLEGTPGEVEEAWQLLLSMMPTHVNVSRGVPGPQQSRDAGLLTVRYNMFQWDK